MQYLEKVVHPRWPTAFEAAKHFVGVVILLLTAALLLTPVPLSNIALQKVAHSSCRPRALPRVAVASPPIFVFSKLPAACSS
jgi:hypothetical protein